MLKTFIGISTAALIAAAPAFAADNSNAADAAKPQTTAQGTATSGDGNAAGSTATGATQRKDQMGQTDQMDKKTTAQSGNADKAAMAGKAWRASNLIGASIVNANNESIGDINDLVVNTDGTVEHVIVGVGGFLGMGERNVALKFSELTVNRNENNRTVITTSMSKQDLEALPVWDGKSVAN